MLRLTPGDRGPIAIGLIALLSLPLAAVPALAQYQEAPALAARVAAGELPPVEERLPVNPVVVAPNQEIGVYGGDWRTALVGGGDTPWIQRTMGGELLIKWNVEMTEIIPNVAESWTASEDGRAYTFVLREGLKWSDGVPFTADDIVFWYEQVARHPQLSPGGFPGWLVAGGEPVVVDKLDDLTVTFSFSEPYGPFIYHLVSGYGFLPLRYPRHYLEQFHADFNPDGIDALVQESGLNTWVDLFNSRSDVFRNSDIPVIWAWTWDTAYQSGGSRAVAVRNPYYFKVDTEGNQLPYLDRIVYDELESVEVLVLKALAGEIDMMDRHIGTLDNKAVFAENMDTGDYSFFDTIPISMINDMAIYFNLNHGDNVKRAIFQNKDFRVGLSHAINRQEIIDLVYVGQGVPSQPAPPAHSPLYDEEFATQFIEFDPALANEYLDRAGYTERDGQGFRLDPTGTRITIVMEVVEAFRPEHLDVLELIALYWGDVGIDLQIRNMDRSLFNVRGGARDRDASVWVADRGGTLDIFTEPGAFLPSGGAGGATFFAFNWGQWYLNPANEDADEPPAEIKRQFELYEQIKAQPDFDLQVSLMKELLEISKDQFYSIGISLPANGYGIVRNTFRNVPEAIFDTGQLYHNPAPTNPSQYYIAPN